MVKLSDKRNEDEDDEEEIDIWHELGKAFRTFTDELGKQLSNISKTFLDIDRPTSREPLIDVTTEGEELRVIAEIPGVAKSDISLDVTENYLDLAASGDQKRYKKRISFPEEVIPDSAKARYRNGILEVTLKRKKSSKRSSLGITVE